MTTTIQATDSNNPDNSMPVTEAIQLARDVALICELAEDIRSDVWVVRVGQFDLSYRWATGKVTVTVDGLILFVATLTARGIGVVSWRQARRPWRRQLTTAIREGVYMPITN